MDGTLRQIGIGDYVVGKHVGRMMSALGGRLGALREGRAQGSLREAVARNIFHGSPPAEAALAFVAGGLERFADAAGRGARGRPARGSAPHDRSRVQPPVLIDTLGEQPRTMAIEAEPAERAALARRFGLPGARPTGGRARHLPRERPGRRRRHPAGRAGPGLRRQRRAGSGRPIVPFEIRFRPLPDAGSAEEELELSEDELDVVFYDRPAIDLGEAVAQTLSLSARSLSPRAGGRRERCAKRASEEGDEEKGPFAALAGLKDKLKP